MNLIKGSLVPLRLPTGWVVRFNNWFYQEAILPNGMPNPLFIENEILLKLSRFEAEYHPDTHFSRDFYLDLFWKGDMASGQYILRFYEDADEDNLLYTFASNQAIIIQEKINECLDLWSIQEFPPIYKSSS